jgi:hypothetical protein
MNAAKYAAYKVRQLHSEGYGPDFICFIRLGEQDPEDIEVEVDPLYIFVEGGWYLPEKLPQEYKRKVAVAQVHWRVATANRILSQWAQWLLRHHNP